MADSPSQRTRVRPPCPGVAGTGTMEDHRQPGGATIVAAPGGGRRAARGDRSSVTTSHILPLSFMYYTRVGQLVWAVAGAAMVITAIQKHPPYHQKSPI